MNIYNVGDIIRNRESGKPYLIIYLNHIGIFVIDPKQGEDPAITKIILNRDLHKYTSDLNMECKKTYKVYEQQIIKWEYKPISL